MKKPHFVRPKITIDLPPYAPPEEPPPRHCAVCGQDMSAWSFTTAHPVCNKCLRDHALGPAVLDWRDAMQVNVARAVIYYLEHTDGQH